MVGAANNQLAVAKDADRLRDAGVVYVPDFLANAGGVINISQERRPGGYSREHAERAVDTIADRVREVLTSAAETGLSTLDEAISIAEGRLRAAARR